MEDSADSSEDEDEERSKDITSRCANIERKREPLITESSIRSTTEAEYFETSRLPLEELEYPPTPVFDLPPSNNLNGSKYRQPYKLNILLPEQTDYSPVSKNTICHSPTHNKMFSFSMAADQESVTGQPVKLKLDSADHTTLATINVFGKSIQPSSNTS